MAMNVGDLNKVWEIKVLKKAGQEEARNILERIAKQVQPIMRKRKWRVKLLSEFCPSDRALLGLNVGGGVHVKLRLRRPNRDWDFYPFDQILDTMLHELCHNSIAPHNANFYKLWDELRKECEELISKGITGTGQGFDLPGRRLGGYSCQPPLSSLRSSSLSAAEKRARLGSLLPSGPNRLGGDNSIMAALSPVQAAAMAAERRMQDDIWCGSSQEVPINEDCCSDIYVNVSGDSSNSFSVDNDLNSKERGKKRSRESNEDSLIHNPYNHSVEASVDLSKDVCTYGSSIDLGNKSLKTSVVKGNQFSQPIQDSSFVDSSRPSSNVVSPNHSEEFAMWACGTCTLLNPPLAPICQLCGSQKPKDVQTKYRLWICKFCTLENSVKLEKCSACAEWRYSNGPPVSTRGPNVGT